MVQITMENPAFPIGTEFKVKFLGVLVNGESVEFSDEQVEAFERERGEGAIKTIVHTNLYEPPVEEEEVEVEEIEPEPLRYLDQPQEESHSPISFPTNPDIPTPTEPVGGDQ